MSAYVEYALSLQSFVHMASVEQSAQQAMYNTGNVPVVSPMAPAGGQMMGGGTKARPRVSTTLWEDESTLCFQVEARGISVARREDNDMINGTKLLNVAGMTRGRRDGMLKAEKDRRVVKIGAMHLKGVWIPFERALSFAQKEGIAEILFPLFVEDIRSYLYRQTNPSGAEIPIILPGEQKYQQSSPAQKSAAPVANQQTQASPSTQSQQPQQPQQQYNRQYPQGYAYGMQGQYSQPMQSVPSAQVQGALQGNLQGSMHANYSSYQYPNYPQMMYPSQNQQHPQQQHPQASAQGQTPAQTQGQNQAQAQTQAQAQAQVQPQGQAQQQVQGQDYAQQMYYPQQGYQPNGYEYPAYYKKE